MASIFPFAHKKPKKAGKKCPSEHPNRVLTKSEQDFAEAWIKHRDIKKAKEECGFGNKNQLFKPAVQQYINERTKEVQKLTNITVQQVLLDLTKVKERCMGNGRNFRPMPAIKALELIGKHLGMFQEEFTSVDKQVNVVINNSIPSLKIPEAGTNRMIEITPLGIQNEMKQLQGLLGNDRNGHQDVCANAETDTSSFNP